LGTLRDFFETFLDICFCLEFFFSLLVVSFTACFKVFFRAFGGFFESFFKKIMISSNGETFSNIGDFDSRLDEKTF
jgi:hypothetical protein